SGSAAAVAGKLVNIAVGTDTAGSIRAPASFCGLIGLRTTHGRISMRGAMRLAPSFDTFGWFADGVETYQAVGRLVRRAGTPLAMLKRPLTIRRVDALVLGSEEAKAYENAMEIVEKALGLTELESPFQASLDELSTCFRRLQAYEGWRIHGAWLKAKPRKLAPGIMEPCELGPKAAEQTLPIGTARRTPL